MSLSVANVKILHGEDLVEGGISIEDGRITRICKTALLPRCEKRIDGRGLIAFPGLIDAHVHLRDMQLAYKEDFSSGTLAAAAGGFTTVLDMPNTSPPTDSDERMREKLTKARTSTHVNVGFYATLRESPTELRRIVDSGAIAFKLYMNEPNEDAWHRDDKRLLSSLTECASLRVPVAFHAENGIGIARAQAACQARNKNSIRDFLRAHAPRFENQAVRTVIELARPAGLRAHVCHLSTRRALSEIHRARRKGIDATCEGTPHHAFLSHEDLKRLRGLALMVPPLRGSNDRRGLWKSIVRGHVDVVASDHAPHAIEEKTSSDIWAVRPGIPGLETTLPLLLTRAYMGEISLSRLVRLLAENPARIFGLRGKGRLERGMDGDVILVDPKERFRIDSSQFLSKAHFSPFDGVECVGRPVMTIISGRIACDRGEIVEKNQGRVIVNGGRS